MRIVNRSLRFEIEDQMKQHGYNINQLAELSGINPGNLNMALNGITRSMTISQLDSLAKVFGKVPGWLYELYTEECISDEKLSRPRLIRYLVRCAEIGRSDCINAVVAKMLDNPKNIKVIFAAAEKLYQKGKRKESEHFYEIVVDSVKDSFSEMLAVSHYRLFTVMQGTDAEKNWKAVIRFDPYRNRLPDSYRLDALFQLAKVCYSLKKWNEVEEYAGELVELSTVLSGLEEIAPKRHPVYYYGMGLLYKGAVLERRGLYDRAKEYVLNYMNLEWPEPLDEFGQKELEQFKIWGKANLYTLELLTGNQGIVNEYADYLASLNRLNDVVSGLNAIVLSANTYGFNVDHVLTRFSGPIARFDLLNSDPILSERHLRFRYHKAIYEFRNDRVQQGINETLHCLSLANVMKKYEDSIQCVALFETYREWASAEQLKMYRSVMGVREEVYLDEVLFPSPDYRIGATWYSRAICAAESK
ncbi:helix-turn-helix transcriptional regulator [Paenibacillus ehimensis]|uniref:helix-turn-helix domain-containing protein n=1 Tax=Paenibacillus ehimensis TaxID=79264 RepID=UPI002DB7250A|nr:helix-turn-helix transcriptional regulator [Paenibacillus ehimensis]MEC0211711.1 helix-turn-helix transcriptional regulator [Paenibacillus ehimensis]